MQNWWRPTAENFFGRVKKTVMLDALEEIGGPILRGRYKDAKKGDLAGTCASLCNAQGIVEAEIRENATAWLPEAMRFDGIEKAARTPLRSSFADDETAVDPDEDEDTELEIGDDPVIDHKEEEDFSQAA